MSWVAVYCRKSVDPGDRGVSVAVQERNGRRYAATHWPDLPIRTYVDNDLSAANPAITRPEYQRLVQDVRAGNVAALVAREQSRLTRQPAEWEALCTTLQLAGLEVVHLTEGGPLSVTEGSRLPGRIMAVVDAEYVEQTRVKVNLALAANAEDGRPHARPGYGYLAIEGEDGRPARVPDPDTAPIVRQMVEAIADGDSLGVVARRLNEAGIPTPRGAGAWRRETVRAIVTAHRLIGQRSHRGRTTKAQWEPIVDRLTWIRAQDRLGRARPGTTTDQRRKYLLTGGLAACAACRTPLISSTTPTKVGPAASYKCPHPSRTPDACGKCSILADRLEDHVTATISEWLTHPAFLDELNRHLTGHVDTEPIMRELEQVDSLLADLAVKWARREFNEVEHAAARRSLYEERDALTAQLAATPAQPVTLDRVLLAWKQGGVARKPLIPVLAETPILVAGAFRDGRRLTVAERIVIRRVGTSSA